MFKVYFDFEGKNINIQCEKNDKMKKIFNKFSEKINLDINITSVYFMYSGNIIKNDELSLGEIINEIDKSTNQIHIVVIKKDTNNSNLYFEKSKEIVCPQCKESAFIYFKNYKISFQCKNGHELKDYLFEQYEETQKIDISKIICEQCKINKKSNTYNQIFFRCNSCKMNLCPICKPKHDKSHKIINYEQKNFICESHNENYSLYCKSCKQNICIYCGNEHTKHETISLGNIITNIEDLRSNYQKLNKKINKFKQNVGELINILNRTVHSFEIYSYIVNDAINNYENKKINYHVLNNIKGIFNHYIIEDLDKIIKDQNYSNKFSYIVNIYNNITNKKMINNSKAITNDQTCSLNSNQKSLYNNLFGQTTSSQNTLYKSLFGDTNSKRKNSTNNPTSNQNFSINNISNETNSKRKISENNPSSNLNTSINNICNNPTTNQNISTNNISNIPTTNQNASTNNISNIPITNQNISTNNISNIPTTNQNTSTNNIFNNQEPPTNDISGNNESKQIIPKNNLKKSSTSYPASNQQTSKNNLFGNHPFNQKFSLEALFNDN